MRILIIIIFYFIAPSIISQVKIATISSKDGTIDKSLPFNEPFILRIPYKKDKITSIEYFELLNKKNTLNSLAQKTYDLNRKNGESKKSFAPNKIPSTNISYKTVDKVNYTYVYFAYPNLLQPGKRYGILAGTEPSEFFCKLLNDFHENSAHLTNGSEKLTKFKKAYSGIIKPKKSRVTTNTDGKITQQEIPIFFGNFDPDFLDDTNFRNELYQYLNTHLSTEFNSIKKVSSDLAQSLDNKIKDLKKIPHNLDYPKLTDSDNIKVLYNDTTNFRKIQGMYNLESSEESIKNILSGYTILGSRIIKKNLSSVDRIKNIESSLKIVNELYSQSNLLNRNFDNYKHQIKYLETFNKSLILSIGYLKKQNLVFKSILTKLKKNNFTYTIPFKNGGKRHIQDFKNVKIFSLDSYIGNFEVRNKLTIAPDLSFGALNPFNSDEQENDDLNYRYLPSLGFSIGLQPVNKNVLFRSYDKTLLQRLTLDFGWSLVSFEEEEKYDNFFEKSTFFSGFGFRISNGLRIQTGAQWLNKVNTTTSKRELTRIPYLGLSVDLSIKDLINGFTDIVGGVKQSKIIETIESN